MIEMHNPALGISESIPRAWPTPSKKKRSIFYEVFSSSKRCRIDLSCDPQRLHSVFVNLTRRIVSPCSRFVALCALHQMRVDGTIAWCSEATPLDRLRRTMLCIDILLFSFVRLSLSPPIVTYLTLTMPADPSCCRYIVDVMSDTSMMWLTDNLGSMSGLVIGRSSLTPTCSLVPRAFPDPKKYPTKYFR